VELRSFFDRAVRASFRDLALHDDAAAGYLADLLASSRARAAVPPPAFTGQRLETSSTCSWRRRRSGRPASFAPEHEVTVRRHIGDYTLFMARRVP